MALTDISEIRIIDVVRMFWVNVSRGERRYINARPTNGIVFTSSGELFYNQNGDRYISDPSHVLILPQSATYTIDCTEDSVCPLIDIVTEPAIFTDKIISFNIRGNTGLIKNFYQYDNLWTFKKGSYKLKCIAGVYDILAKLNESDTPATKSRQRREFIRLSIDYLESHYCEPSLTNEILAEKSNISTVYFRKIFSDIYGVPPMKYLRYIRIEKAKELLRSGCLSIENVAVSAGFGSIYNFSRSFKKETGYAPTEYIKYNKI